MKKKIFVFIIVFSSLLLHSQQKQFTIDWGGVQDYSSSVSKVLLPSFNEENFSYSQDEGIKYVSQWIVSNPVRENSIEILNPTFSPISLQELKDLDKSAIPNQLKFNLRNSIARNIRYVYFDISPIIKNASGSYQKLISFGIKYNSGYESRQFSGMSVTPPVGNSILSSGSWYKFYITQTGVHRISKSFLSDLGINMNNIDPRTIKLYGNGGKMIPYANSEEFPYDIEQNAIKIIGEEDGYFDDSDYILFYGQGPYSWDEEKGTHINCYNDKTYYYLNISSGNGKRIQPFVQPSGSPDLQITAFDDYQFHEIDEYNLANLGRRWFGDEFNIEDTQTFSFNFPDIDTTEVVNLNVKVAAISSINTSMAVNMNGLSITNLNINAISESTLFNNASYSGFQNVSNETINVQLTYNRNGNPSATAFVDYVSLEAKRQLNFSGSQYTFRNNDVVTSSGVGEYVISNSEQVSEIWDVTDIYNVTSAINVNPSSIMSFKSNLGVLKNYAIVTSLDLYAPQRDAVTTVANQNLKGTIFNNNQGQFEDIDYIIITPNIFAGQAERLAQINRSQYGLNVKVVTLNTIYNEFNTGNPDIAAIRNFIKYVYDNASSEDRRLKYVCFFGDGSFDYKDRISNNTNFVPSWYSENSRSLGSSFVSDDFYGMMDENEGDMSISDKLDIAVGRILADSPQMAVQLVDKIDLYYKEASYGNWRNNVVLISDDVDESWESTLQNTTNEIGDIISQEKPFINVTKIHSDAYQQESSSGGDRYPDVNVAILNAIEKGALVVNYFGHGGEDGLAAERIFMKADAQELNNVCKLNCFITVTCEFTRFDNPFRPTAGEYTYWNTQGGAISMITTTRQISVNTGKDINEVLTDYLFSIGSSASTSEYPTMAEALRLTKTNPEVTGYDKRLVFYIGDPAMKLAIPQPNVVLTHINDVPLGSTTEILKALDKVKLSGEVTDNSGNHLSNFNGVVYTTVYDKNIERQTLGNDGVTSSNDLIILDFETLGATIFKGQSSIVNGQFEMEFVVPRDIVIPVGTGKVSFYVKQESQLLDKAGANVDEVQIGGLNENAEEDSEGPLINLFMNDESFVSGGLTNSSPALLVKLQDENGINTASGIGHDITAILDGDESNPYVLNDYYESELDNYQRGNVNYPFRELENGLHTLTIRAWDVYNNSSVAEIQFMVQNENQELVIDKVLNYPNPFVNYTEFWFNHNSSQPLDVSVQIFTVTGKLVKTINGQTNTSNCCNNGTSSLSRDMIWDGRDDFGERIGKGVYVYKLKVHSPSLNKTVEKIEKLVIL